MLSLTPMFVIVTLPPSVTEPLMSFEWPPTAVAQDLVNRYRWSGLGHRHPRLSVFPYTTLFRSGRYRSATARASGSHDVCVRAAGRRHSLVVEEARARSQRHAVRNRAGDVVADADVR